MGGYSVFWVVLVIIEIIKTLFLITKNSPKNSDRYRYLVLVFGQNLIGFRITKKFQTCEDKLQELVNKRKVLHTL